MESGSAFGDRPESSQQTRQAIMAGGTAEPSNCCCFEDGAGKSVVDLERIGLGLALRMPS